MFRNILKYGYFILCISVFFSIEQKLYRIKLETPLEWFIPIFNVSLLLYGLKNRFAVKINKWFFVSLSALAIAVIASIINSEVILHSVKGAVVWISYFFAFAGGFWILNFDEKEKKHLLWVCGVSYGILLLYSFVRYLVIGIEYHNSYKMALPLANGHTLLIAMAFPIWIYFANICIKNPRKNVYLILFFVFYTSIVYLSYSRFYWVFATLLIGIIFLYHYPKWIKPVIISGMILSISVYIAYIKISEYRNKNQVWLDPKDHTSLFVQIESVFVLSKNESNAERINRWNASLIMFSQNIWTGVGINTFPERYYTYLDKIPKDKLKETTRKDDYMNAHNLYIGTMAEEGILGLLALLFFTTLWVYYWKKLGFLAKLIFAHYVFLGLIEDFTLLVDIIPCFWVCVAWGIKNL
jgi:O-antigen ligase